ncbi:MAG: hypothetical protein ACI9ZH_000147 [Paracoccaceae bacterium]|jgi:uncharacterized protein (DUF2062 family)
MVFKRRDKPPVWSRIRQYLSPRKGWRRGYLYLGKRMQRLPDTPHRIALGFACGVQVSFTPLFGFHFFAAAALAFLFRGNMLSSAVGTFVGNPLTFPLIASSSFWLGSKITGIHVGAADQGHDLVWLWDNLDAIFVPYLVGGLAPGLIAAVGFYWLVRPMVAAFQNRRRLMLMDRAKQRMKDHATRNAARRRRMSERAADANNA